MKLYGIIIISKLFTDLLTFFFFRVFATEGCRKDAGIETFNLKILLLNKKFARFQKFAKFHSCLRF